MRRNRNRMYALLSAIGFILFAAGLVVIKFSQDAEGILRTLPYICIGIGAGVFGYNFGELMKNLAVRKDPQAAKQIEIEAKDERNIAISNKAKAKAYDLMLIIFGALMMAFALMQIEIYVLLTFVTAYLIIVFTCTYYLWKYQKNM